MCYQHLFEFQVSGRGNLILGTIRSIEALDACAELPERTAVDLLRRVAYCSAGPVES
jgi:hypothetical protein